MSHLDLATLEEEKARIVAKRVWKVSGHRSKAATSLDISHGTLRKYLQMAEEDGWSVPDAWEGKGGDGTGLTLTEYEVERVREGSSRRPRVREEPSRLGPCARRGRLDRLPRP
jgi:transposase